MGQTNNYNWPTPEDNVGNKALSVRELANSIDTSLKYVADNAGGSVSVADGNDVVKVATATKLTHRNAVVTAVGANAVIENTIIVDDIEDIPDDLPDGMTVIVKNVEPTTDGRKTVSASYVQLLSDNDITVVSETDCTVTIISAANMWQTGRSHIYTQIGAGTLTVACQLGETMREMGGGVSEYELMDSESLVLKAYKVSEGVYSIKIVSSS